MRMRLTVLMLLICSLVQPPDLRAYSTKLPSSPGVFTGTSMSIQGYHDDGSEYPSPAHISYGWFLGLEAVKFDSGPTIGCELEVPIAPFVSEAILDDMVMRITCDVPLLRYQPDGKAGTIALRSVVYVPSVQAGVAIPLSSSRPLLLDLKGSWLRVDFGDLALSIGDLSVQFTQGVDGGAWLQYAGWGISPLRMIYRNW